MLARVPVSLAVFCGGVVGATLRWALTELLPRVDDAIPAATLIANVAGSFALGALVALVSSRDTAEPLVAFLGVGVLGSFTTFSALMVEAAGLTLDDRPGLAVCYLVLTIGCGLGAAGLGAVGVARISGTAGSAG